MPIDNLQIKRSRRKTMGLYIKDNGVEVRAPYFVPDADIHAWVNSKHDWIQEKLAEQAQKHQEKTVIQHGAQLPFLGRTLTLDFIRGKPDIIEGNQRLIVSLQTNSKPEKLVAQWLRQEAEHYLTPRTQELAGIMGDSDRLQGIQYRKTKSKWGHCTSQGILQFNWLVIMAPPEVIDYLIIHELSHLRHMNHSSRFWQRVERFCPDYKTHKQWLNDNGHRLWLS